MAGRAVIVAGFGFRAAATADSLADALEMTGGSARIAALATVADKAEAAPFLSFAAAAGLPIRSVDASALARQETATLSAASLATRGTGSVAEAAALAAAGPGARLISRRAASGDGMATCALAEGGDG